eukprot:scaffold38855_cov59-Phaeocystis_antarctica.AAC.1
MSYPGHAMIYGFTCEFTGTCNPSPPPPPAPPPAPPAGSCMFGNTGTFKPSENSTGSFERTVIIVKELTVGDKIEGLDAEKQPALCTVEAIGMFGHGALDGNYTEDHFVLDPTTGNVMQHGAVGNRTVEDRYDVMMSCPVGLDEAGTGFTPITDDAREASHKGLPGIGVVDARGSASFVISQGKASSTERTLLIATGAVAGAEMVALFLAVAVVARTVRRRKRSPPAPATVELEPGTLKLDLAAAPEVAIA